MFNFKKLPGAAIAAIVLILLIEGGAWLSLQTVRRIDGNGDLIRLDSDFFNRNLRKYDTDPPMDKEVPERGSWKECWANAPYDVMVVGDSTGITGWAEILRADCGINILNLAFSVNRGLVRSANLLLGNYEGRYKHIKTVLLEVGLVRGHYEDMPGIGELIRESKERDFPRLPAMSNTEKIIEYISNKISYLRKPSVEIVDIQGRAELFLADNINALAKPVHYPAEEYSKLCERLQYVKDSAAKKGCVYAVVAFPTKPQQYEWLLIKSGRLKTVSERTDLKMLKEACRVCHIPFLDVEEKLVPIAERVFRDTGKLLWRRCDTHMNETGARYSAAIINTFLSEIKSGKLPPSS